MTDIEMRAHLLTIEYLRLLVDGGRIQPTTTPEVYALNYKQNYQRILAELKK
jgi:hypothetical protein